MPSKLVNPSILVAATCLLAEPSAAADPIVEQRGWPIVARAESTDCAAEVRGNGKIFVIAGAGLRAGEVVQFHLTNADIRPLQYRIVADSSGSWSKYYMPFLWGRPGGRVSVNLASVGCDLTLAFDWRRDTQGYNTRYDMTM